MFVKLTGQINSLVSALKRLIAFIKESLCEWDGSGSSSRIVKLSVAVSVIIAFLYHVFHHHGLPTQEQMLGLSALLGAGASPYAFNQIRAAFKKDGATVPDNPDKDS